MEIELKLRIAPATPQVLAALRADPLLQSAEPLPAGARRQLDNIYFDTADHSLARSRVGLRLRKDGKQWLQTVKGGGSAEGGLHQRDEIEFALAGPALDLQRLADTPFAALLLPLEAQLKPVFRTKFIRDSRLLRGSSGAQIEAAIDEGDIIAGRRRMPLCELELELKSGAVDDLFELAMRLVERHGLVLDNQSKAERGFALAGIQARSDNSAAPAKAGELVLPAGATVATLAHHAVANCLAHWQATRPVFWRNRATAAPTRQKAKIRPTAATICISYGWQCAACGWQPARLPALPGGTPMPCAASKATCKCWASNWAARVTGMCSC